MAAALWCRAANPDKQPWTYGEPYTSINRMYLQLKSVSSHDIAGVWVAFFSRCPRYRCWQALTPYQYTYSRIAAETGMPPVRAMALQFPGAAALHIHQMVAVRVSVRVSQRT